MCRIRRQTLRKHTHTETIKSVEPFSRVPTVKWENIFMGVVHLKGAKCRSWLREHIQIHMYEQQYGHMCVCVYGYTRKPRRNEWNASIRRRVENVKKVRQNKKQIPKLTTHTQPTHAHKNKKSKIKTGKGQQWKTTTQSNVWEQENGVGRKEGGGNYTRCFLSVCVWVCVTRTLSLSLWNHSGTSIVYWSRDLTTTTAEAAQQQKRACARC